MKPELIPIIVAMIVGLFGLAGGVWAYRKNRSEAAESLINSAMTLVKQYEASLKEAEQDIKDSVIEAKALSARAVSAEANALAATLRVSDLEKVVELMNQKLATLEEERIKLRETVATLETQIDSLGYIPKTRISRSKKGEEK